MFFTAPERLAYCEYGMTMTRQPGPEEWAEFYLQVEVALKDGRIDISDLMYLREVDNIKQARQLMAIREKIYRRRMREEAALAVKQQTESNTQAAMDKLNNDLTVLREKGKIDAALKELDGSIQMRLLDQKDRNAFMSKRLESQTKTSIGRIAANAEVIKTAQKNIPEKEANMIDLAQLDIDREKNRIDEKKVEVMAKKPAAKAK
jgi:hypothetical protein